MFLGSKYLLRRCLDVQGRTKHMVFKSSFQFKKISNNRTKKHIKCLVQTSMIYIISVYTRTNWPIYPEISPSQSEENFFAASKNDCNQRNPCQRLVVEKPLKKYATVELDHFPQKSGVNKHIFETTPLLSFFKGHLS